MAAKKKAKAKKKAVKKAVKKSAKKPVKKKVAKKAAKKSAKKPGTKTARKSSKKSAKPKKTAKPKKAMKAAKPAAAKGPKGKPVTFILDAPNGWDVSIAASFNNWEPRAMTKDTDGIWRITEYLLAGSHQYKFLVDTEWHEDPMNPRKRLNEYGGFNSIIDVT